MTFIPGRAGDPDSSCIGTRSGQNQRMNKAMRPKGDPALVWDQLLTSPSKRQGNLATQLITSFIDAIDGNQIPEGVRVPSSRSLARSLGVGRNTVIAAINSLVEQGYLVAVDRAGVFVASGRFAQARFQTSSPATNTYDWDTRLGLSKATSPTRPIGSRLPPVSHNFIYGQFDPSTFPTSHWRQCERSSSGLSEIAEWGRDMFDRDDEELITCLRRHVLPQHGIWAEADEILVTLGGQEGRYLVAKLLCKPDTVVGLENPGLPDMREIVSATPAKQVFMPIDDQGVMLSKQLRSADVIFMMPGHHCPTTAFMPVARRHKLIQTCKKLDIIPVEDTYEIDVVNYRNSAPSLKSLDDDGRVIHIGSFSKSVAPGLRIGYVVAAPEVISELRELRRLIHRHPPGNNQRAIAMFIDRGFYHSYLRRVSGVLRRRSSELRIAMERLVPEVKSAHCDGASSFWLELPPDIDSQLLASELCSCGVAVESGERFFFDKRPKNFLRIAVSQIEEREIQGGVRKIKEAIGRVRNSS